VRERVCVCVLVCVCVCAAGGSPFEREGGVGGLLDRDEREGERECQRARACVWERV